MVMVVEVGEEWEGPSMEEEEEEEEGVECHYWVGEGPKAPMDRPIPLSTTINRWEAEGTAPTVQPQQQEEEEEVWV